MDAAGRHRGGSLALLLGTIALLQAPISAAAAAEPMTSRESPAPSAAGTPIPVERLIDEALAHNPELAAARAEGDAAQQRVAPAAALEDPMLELGVVNAPLPSFSFHAEDMTMKMLGVSQKLPFPGKRDLRQAVASADSSSVSFAVEETANRVIRGVRVAYEDLRLADETERILTRARNTLKELAALADARYAVGQVAQSDVLQAQARAVQLQQELISVDQERVTRQDELRRLLGRRTVDSWVTPTPLVLLSLHGDPAAFRDEAATNRPQLRALDALVTKNERAIELAQRDYYPDFELRLSYGQRERTVDGMPRDDMITMTVAVNLPIWRKSRLEPRVAEARAMRQQAAAMADAQRVETLSGLQQQLAIETHSRASVALNRSTLLPQAHALVESAVNGYRVGRVDFLTVLDAEMREYEAERAQAQEIAAHNKAVAEIDFLTGAAPAVIEGVRP